MLRRAWGGLLDALRLRRPRSAADIPERVSPSPLPAALAERLRHIPRDEVLCRDLDRRWPELARGELPAPRAAALTAHREGCERCARVTAVLVAALTEPPRPLPARLFFRLTALAQPARPPTAALPAFLRDSRWAMAASALVSVLLATVAGGDPIGVAARAAAATSSRVRQAVPAWHEPLAGTWQQAKAHGRELAHAAAVSWQAGLSHGRGRAAALYEIGRRRGAVLEAGIETRLGRRLDEIKQLLPPALAGAERERGETPDPARSRRPGEETENDGNRAPRGAGTERPDGEPRQPFKDGE